MKEFFAQMEPLPDCESLDRNSFLAGFHSCLATQHPKIHPVGPKLGFPLPPVPISARNDSQVTSSWSFDLQPPSKLSIGGERREEMAQNPPFLMALWGTPDDEDDEDDEAQLRVAER